MRFRWFITACLLQVMAGGVATADPVPGTITVDVLNLRAEQGWELCALYASAEGFPFDFARAVQHLRVPIQSGHASCVFSGVASGTYAISVVRDEDGTGLPVLDFLDLPKNGVGASNEARGFMGPPRFEDARFVFKGSALRMAIKMTYRTAK